MKHHVVTSAFAALIIALLTACGAKNPEKETITYHEKLATAKQVVATYPAFSSALNSQIEKADVALKASESIADRKEKAKAIRKASNMLSGGLFSKIKSVKSKISEVKTESITLTGKGSSFSDLARISAVTEQAKEVAADAEETLEKGASNPDEALAILKNTEAELDGVLNTLKNLIKEANAKNASSTVTTKPVLKAKPVGTSSTKPVLKAKPVTTVKPAAQWKCEYCSGMNKPEKVKCVNCGAPKKK